MVRLCMSGRITQRGRCIGFTAGAYYQSCAGQQRQKHEADGGKRLRLFVFGFAGRPFDYRRGFSAEKRKSDQNREVFKKNERCCFIVIKECERRAEKHVIGNDALYAAAYEKRNVAYLGKGMVFNKFTGSRGKSGSSDANAEYVGKLREILDKHNVRYQFSELGKVDLGGGGTIAYIMAEYGMNVIDSGVAVLSMHAPWEATSKVDIYETKKGYSAFLTEI